MTFPSWWKDEWSVASRAQRTRDWAEEHYLVLRGSRTGPFRLATNPMIGPILDLLEHPLIRETYGMKGVQTGFSEAQRIDAAKDFHTDPSQQMLILPSKQAGRDQIKKYWKPVLTGKGCPILRQFQRRRKTLQGRPRKGGRPRAIDDDVDRTTYENIVGSNGFDLLLGYSGSVTSLASHPCKKVRLDELDKFADWDGEATPHALAKARTETFQETRKIHGLSTPTTENGEIAKLFYAADIQLYPFIACPACAHPIQLLFDNVTWDLPSKKDLPDPIDRAKLLRREPQRVWLGCGHCKAKVGEQERLRLLASGWLGTLNQSWQLYCDGREVGRPAGETVGVHFPTLASAMGASMVEQAAEWIVAEGSPRLIQNCKNNHHGLPFTSDQVKPAKGLLRRKCRDDEETGWRAPDGGKVPPWASRLFMTIDTQKDKFYWVIRAWGRNRRSRLIAHGEAFSFEQLEDLIYRRKWPNEDPTLPDRTIFLAAIDSGGGIDREHEDSTRTEQVYRWCAADARRRIALKGVQSKKYETMTRQTRIEYQSPTHGDVIHVNLLWVNPLDSGDALAAAIAAQVESIDSKTGEVLELKIDQWELNRDTTNEYIRHIEVMERKTFIRRGRKITIYKESADGARHDYYDCERYQQALAHHPTIACDALPSEADLRAQAAIASNQQQARQLNARPGPGVTTPDGRPFLANKR